MDPVLLDLLNQTIATLAPVLGTLLGSLVTWGVWQLIGLIKNKQARDLAGQAVAYAQQRLTSNDARLDYAKTYLKGKLGSRVSESDIDHFIEQAVLELKGNLQAKPTPPPLPPNDPSTH